MARGEKESKCLEAVKSVLMSHDNIFYACSLEDEDIIQRLLKTAQPNSDLNKFPDFICDEGFIEQFEVTSSYSNKKGSKMRIELDDLQKKANARESELQEQMNEEPSYAVKSVVTDKWHSVHSYEYFCNSFKARWEHHIDRLGKYDGNKTIGCFMIQYDDSALTLDNNCEALKTGLFYGDLVERPQYRGYRLTHDERILEYIYQFKDMIHFVAFYNNDKFHGKRCEIVCVENIPEILKIVKDRFVFHCSCIGSMRAMYGISVTDMRNKGNDDNDQT